MQRSPSSKKRSKRCSSTMTTKYNTTSLSLKRRKSRITQMTTFKVFIQLRMTRIRRKTRRLLMTWRSRSRMRRKRMKLRPFNMRIRSSTTNRFWKRKSRNPIRLRSRITSLMFTRALVKSRNSRPMTSRRRMLNSSKRLVI